MKTISIALNKYSYPIWIDIDLIKVIPRLLTPINRGQQWVIFSQDKVYLKYGKYLSDALISKGFKVSYISIVDGEEAKSFKYSEKIYSKVIKLKCDRSSFFISLGGGVIGDLIGFVAATYLRGVNYINIPTTLLSMVDSSIGGKTGLNLKEGKNLIGAFWHPKAVIIDPNILKTLPKREFVSALGEIIKYGAIFDKKFLKLISKNIDNIINFKKISLIEEIITYCIKLKVKIIIQDERESNIRRILNFGHTVGHALEIYCGYDKLRHGEAIAYGMLVSAKLSMIYAKLKLEEFKLLTNIINKLPLPKLKKIHSKDILKIIQKDKKNKDGNFNFVLLDKIGKPIIVDKIDNGKILECINFVTN